MLSIQFCHCPQVAKKIAAMLIHCKAGWLGKGQTQIKFSAMMQLICQFHVLIWCISFSFYAYSLLSVYLFFKWWDFGARMNLNPFFPVSLRTLCSPLLNWLKILFLEFWFISFIFLYFLKLTFAPEITTKVCKFNSLRFNISRHNSRHTVAVYSRLDPLVTATAQLPVIECKGKRSQCKWASDYSVPPVTKNIQYVNNHNLKCCADNCIFKTWLSCSEISFILKP